ncbi:MAG: response regulator, partial [Acidobacteriota bacterium]
VEPGPKPSLHTRSTAVEMTSHAEHSAVPVEAAYEETATNSARVVAQPPTVLAPLPSFTSRPPITIRMSAPPPSVILEVPKAQPEAAPVEEVQAAPDPIVEAPGSLAEVPVGEAPVVAEVIALVDAPAQPHTRQPEVAPPAGHDPVAQHAISQHPLMQDSEGIRETILVVDDEAGIRGLMRKILRRERYGVLEAASAEEAQVVAAAAGRKINLLLTDVMLPGMQGPELAKLMYEADPQLKVLYISGYTEDEATRAGNDPPGSKFLAKPFTLGALLSHVRTTLDEA